MVLGVRGAPSKESPDASVSLTCFNPKKIKVRHWHSVIKDNDYRKISLKKTYFTVTFLFKYFQAS